MPQKEKISGDLPEPETRLPSLCEKSKHHGEFFAALELQDEIVFFSEDEV